MKTLVTKITDRGQVSVPSSIRKELHLEPGTRVCWESISEQECRIYVQRRANRKSAASMLGYAATFRDAKPTESWMNELRSGES